MVSIKRISPGSASKVCGVLFLLLGLLSGIIIVITDLASNKTIARETIMQASVWVLVFGPCLYGVFGLVAGAIVAWFYNITVRFTGGLVIETEEKRGFSAISEPS